MFTLLAVMIDPAVACPEDVAAATTELETRRAEYREARAVARETDWETYLALDDRDQVLARQAQAFEALRESRTAVREAKRALNDVEGNKDVACDPAPTESKTS